MTNFETGSKMPTPLELLTIKLNEIADTVRTESAKLEALKNSSSDSSEPDSDLQEKIFASETRIDLLNETLRKLLAEEVELKKKDSLKKFTGKDSQNKFIGKDAHFDWNESPLHQNGKPQGGRATRNFEVK